MNIYVCMCAWHFSLQGCPIKNVWRLPVWTTNSKEHIWGTGSLMSPSRWLEKGKAVFKVKYFLKSWPFSSLGETKASKMVLCPLQHLRGREEEQFCCYSWVPSGKASIMGLLRVYPIMLGGIDSNETKISDIAGKPGQFPNCSPGKPCI